MTHRTTAFALAVLLAGGIQAVAGQEQDSGQDRPARSGGGEGPRLNPRLARPERVQPAAPVPAIVHPAPNPGDRADAAPPNRGGDTRVFAQRGRRGGGGDGRARGGGGRDGSGGDGGDTVIIDGSRGGQPRVTQRPRDGGPPRVIQRGGGGPRGRVVVPRRIYPYAYGGFGLGYFYYDPFWSPWGPWGGPWGYPGAYGYYGGGHQDDFGKVRLDVKGPRDAQVLVDGYYAGTLDDFDGAFQGLELESGAYRIEVEANGYDRLTFDTRVTDGRKITLHGALRRVEP